MRYALQVVIVIAIWLACHWFAIFVLRGAGAIGLIGSVIGFWLGVRALDPKTLLDRVGNGIAYSLAGLIGGSIFGGLLIGAGG